MNSDVAIDVKEKKNDDDNSQLFWLGKIIFVAFSLIYSGKNSLSFLSSVLLCSANTRIYEFLAVGMEAANKSFTSNAINNSLASLFLLFSKLVFSVVFFHIFISCYIFFFLWKIEIWKLWKLSFFFRWTEKSFLKTFFFFSLS